MLDTFLLVCGKILSAISALFAAIPFSTATWFVLAIISAIVWLFVKADRDENCLVQWEHLIISSTTNRVCPYKLGYFIGMIVSTWVVVYLVDTHKKIDFDTFGLYLAYLLGGTGWSSWLKAKSGKQGTEENEENGERK